MAESRTIGASRVIQGNSKAEPRSRGFQDDSQEQQQNQQAQQAQSAQQQGTRLLNRLRKRQLKTPPGVSATNMRRIEAGSAAMVIFWSGISFVIPQVIFWLIGIGFIATKLTPLVGQWIPGEAIFFIFWFFIMTIGVCTMVYATIIFLLRGIDCFSGMKGIIFIMCLTGYFVFFINFFPYFLIWIFSVVMLQRKE